MYVFNFHSNVPFCPGQYNFTGNALFIVNNNVTLDCNGAVIKGQERMQETSSESLEDGEHRDLQSTLQ
jgi:hypothetical protein